MKASKPRSSDSRPAIPNIYERPLQAPKCQHLLGRVIDKHVGARQINCCLGYGLHFAAIL